MKNILFIKPILLLLFVVVASCKENAIPHRESMRGVERGQNNVPQHDLRDLRRRQNIGSPVIEPASLSFSINPVSILKKGQKADLKIIARDASGKQIPSGGLEISLESKALEGRDHVDIAPLIDHKDGSYTALLTAKNLGRFTLDALIKTSGLRVSLSPIIISDVVPQLTFQSFRHGVPYVEEIRQVLYPDPCKSFPSYCIPDPGVNLRKENAMLKLGAMPDKNDPHILRANLSNNYYVERDIRNFYMDKSKRYFNTSLHWPAGIHQPAGSIFPGADYQNKCSKHYRPSDKTDQDVVKAIMDPANGIVSHSTERMTWERWGEKEFEDVRIGMDPPFDLKYIINFGGAHHGPGLYVASNPVSSASFAKPPPNNGLITVVAPANAPIIYTDEIGFKLFTLGFQHDVFKECPIPALIGYGDRKRPDTWWTLKTHRVEKSPGVWENLIIKDFTGEYYTTVDLFRFKNELLEAISKTKLGVPRHAYDTYWAKIQKTLSKRIYNPNNPTPKLPLNLTAVHPVVTTTHPDGKNWSTVPELVNLDPNKFITKATKPEYFWRFDGSCGKYYFDGEILGEDFVPVQACIDNHAPTAGTGGFGGSLCLNKAQTKLQGKTPTCDYLLDLGLNPQEPIRASYAHQGIGCGATTPLCPALK